LETNTMTDQTQSAVEAMARAIDEIADARGECPGDSARLNNPDECSQAALTAFLAHITASGWQIVPVAAIGERDDEITHLRATLAERDAEIAACEIECLRMQRQTILAAFRVNMMRLIPGYSHEAFDQHIAEILAQAPEAT
jgi:hypothetical protein